MSALANAKAGDESDEEEVPPLADEDAEKPKVGREAVRLCPAVPRPALTLPLPRPTPQPPTPQEPEVDTSLANSDVNTKYLEAAKIANLVLQEVADLVSISAASPPCAFPRAQCTL